MKNSEPSHRFDFGLLLFLLVIGIIGYRNFQYYRTFIFLRHLDPEHVKSVKIYPGVAGPSDLYIDVASSDPMTPELLESFTGSRAIWLPKRFMVSNGFFLEIDAGDRHIQGVFRIPAGKTYVVGEFGKWRQSSATFYGEFRSKKLFQWYQKYSHRWLTPDESQEPFTQPAQNP